MASALDTNCLIRWLMRDVPSMTGQVESLLAGKERLHVADIAIAEMVWVLKKVYGADDSTIVDSVNQVITHKNINCNEVLFAKVIGSYLVAPKVSFVDLCLAYYADLQDATLLTFDKTLARKLPKAVKLLG